MRDLLATVLVQLPRTDSADSRASLFPFALLLAAGPGEYSMAFLTAAEPPPPPLKPSSTTSTFLKLHQAERIGSFLDMTTGSESSDALLTLLLQSAVEVEPAPEPTALRYASRFHHGPGLDTEDKEPKTIVGLVAGCGIQGSAVGSRVPFLAAAAPPSPLCALLATLLAAVCVFGLGSNRCSIGSTVISPPLTPGRLSCLGLLMLPP